MSDPFPPARPPFSFQVLPPMADEPHDQYDQKVTVKITYREFEAICALLGTLGLMHSFGPEGQGKIFYPPNFEATTSARIKHLVRQLNDLLAQADQEGITPFINITNQSRPPRVDIRLLKEL